MSNLGIHLGKDVIDQIFKPQDLPQFAAKKLGLNVRVREKQIKDRAYLKVTILTPHGVKLEGKYTDVMSFEISGKLEGSNKLVTHYLVLWSAAALSKLAPQILVGEITHIPNFVGGTVH